MFIHTIDFVQLILIGRGHDFEIPNNIISNLIVITILDSKGIHA